MGYHRFIDWAGVAYVGVDAEAAVVEDCQEYFSFTGRLAAHGLVSARFIAGDACGLLPPADLLLVKDVLDHLPHANLVDFLRNHTMCHNPRYRFVMLIHSEVLPAAGFSTVFQLA